MTSKTRIHLIRHGEVVTAGVPRYNGHADVALSDYGRDQYRAMAERLADVPLAAVYCSDLFYASPEISPQLCVGRTAPVDYSTVQCPVAERAAYEESVWLPQFLLLGEERDVDEVASAVEKVMRGLDELAGADPALAGLKAMSRTERPKYERQRNY